ncbi:tetratricopeptide repeat protein [uncultured Sunxiuqinia sp.]|uniref:SPOR domain-containing protein n=1 Tax=uncultured Sunxiuqinia sp. TaxID=1573825 RepID=UPI002AA780B5|nr:tetratricopeptide repeat protein [uncultured Sunxiuqinia sp.]
MTTFHRTTSFLLLFLVGLCFIGKTALAQNDPEQLAKNLIEEEKYAEALSYFKDLVHLYPQDKELNYYLGMCLAETEQLGGETKEALQLSLGTDTPAKSLYYLAQCFHAEENYTEALSYYKQFDNEAKNRVKRSTKLDKLIDFSEKQINPFPKAEQQPDIEPDVKQKKEVQKVDTLEKQKPIQIEIPAGLEDSLINFQVNSTIKYLKIDQFKNPKSLQAFIQAWQDEQDLKQILIKTKNLRDKYHSALANEKEDITNKILTLEQETYSKNQVINEQYIEARKREINYWEQADQKDIQSFSQKIKTMEDSIQQAREAERIKKLEAEKPVVLPDSLVKNLMPDEPATADNEVTYKIQIGAYSKTPPDWVQRLFKKLSVIRRIDQYTDENGVTVYTVGELKSYGDALQMQSQVRTEGVKDAFIAAYKNGTRIPVKEARSITEG